VTSARKSARRSVGTGGAAGADSASAERPAAVTGPLPESREEPAPAKPSALNPHLYQPPSAGNKNPRLPPWVSERDDLAVFMPTPEETFATTASAAFDHRRRGGLDRPWRPAVRKVGDAPRASLGSSGADGSQRVSGALVTSRVIRPEDNTEAVLPAPPPAPAEPVSSSFPGYKPDLEPG
jgi:hypothetical protein